MNSANKPLRQDLHLQCQAKDLTQKSEAISVTEFDVSPDHSQIGMLNAKGEVCMLDTINALLSTNIGSLTLTAPFALFQMGLVFGAIYIIFIGFVCHFTLVMYIQTKQLMPFRAESIYEIAYSMFGRKSIFIMCSVLFVDCFGCVVIMYMMIGDTVSQIFTSLILSENTKSDDDEAEELSICAKVLMH